MDTVLLIGPKADEPFTDDLQSSMEDAGFTVLRIADPASLTQATTAIAVVSGNEDPWLAEDLKKCHAAHKPVLVIALDDVEIPECMASYRCLQNSDSGVRMNSATSWLTQVLDRSESEFSPEAPPSMPSAFWNRRLALASGDIQRGAGAIFSLIAGSVQRCAVAIARDVVITPGEDL